MGAGLGQRDLPDALGAALDAFAVTHPTGVKQQLGEGVRLREPGDPVKANTVHSASQTVLQLSYEKEIVCLKKFLMCLTHHYL